MPRAECCRSLKLRKYDHEAPASENLQKTAHSLAVLEAQRINDQQITNVLARFDDRWQTMQPKEQVRLVRVLIEIVNFDGPSVPLLRRSTGESRRKCGVGCVEAQLARREE
jgi:hypothetical protein